MKHAENCRAITMMRAYNPQFMLNFFYFPLIPCMNDLQ